MKLCMGKLGNGKEKRPKGLILKTLEWCQYIVSQRKEGCFTVFIGHEREREQFVIRTECEPPSLQDAALSSEDGVWVLPTLDLLSSHAASKSFWRSWGRWNRRWWSCLGATSVEDTLDIIHWARSVDDRFQWTLRLWLRSCKLICLSIFFKFILERDLPAIHNHLSWISRLFWCLYIIWVFTHHVFLASTRSSKVKNQQTAKKRCRNLQ